MNKTSWDLTVLFKTNEEFLKTLEEFKSLIPNLAAYKGQLADEKKLAGFLRLDKKANMLLVRCYYYASMHSDQNKKDIHASADLGKVSLAMQEYGTAVSFQSPELLAIGEEKLGKFLSDNPEFAEYEFQFRSLFLERGHILSGREENLLSLYSPLARSPRSLYSQLTTADGKAKSITLSTGEEVTVTQANWTSLVAKAEREEDRQAIFEALYSHYDEHKSTYGEIYNLSLQAQLANMRARGYSSILESHLYGRNIPLDVFHTLIKVASEGSEPLRKYLNLRAKYLGLEKHRSYDRFLQLAKPKRRYTYEEAKELFYDSISSFPDDFQAKAREVTKEGYVDVYPGVGKRSGAYSNGGYDIHPFILLNFVGELDDVFTLAHENAISASSSD